uniref:Arginine biosynthesis bifunctional protein ArgJ n=1 Tax=Magnetococcus massalia (strain MO-1) TaxID=451514 RepID=A0A1S7LM18_MAGMO|nr:bifunctional arginine biosynthesis, Glutamate N-acetyltransferase [Candidatus Magnetococcus massalia]
MAVGAPPTLELPPVAGFRAAATACGVKKGEILDLMLVEMDSDTRAAGTFTKNRVCAAPVILCRDRLPEGRAGALLVNAGNANACTGPKGMLDALANSKCVADSLNISDNAVFISSTGVVGEPLPVDKINGAIPGLVEALAPGNWQAAAEAIMTTDTFAKTATRNCTIEGQTVTLVGMAKGSGMIHPNMATMLSYIFTDAAIESEALQALLTRATELSFNCITVDGDSSTNDTLMLFASGQAGEEWMRDAADPRLADFSRALNELAIELAQWVVRDGEGASKFVTIKVEQARSEAEAKQVAMSVAQSSLVKTACAGSDPNWGRIHVAVGYSGVDVEEDLIDIYLGDALIVEKGQRAASYREEMGQAVMDREEITITIQLGQGSDEATVWTCDLTHGYITINADYRT